MINKIRKKNNLADIDEINLNDYINLDTLCKKVFNFIKNKKTKNFNLQLLINNLTYENINLVTTLNVNFVRDNKNYTKPIYLILTEYMKDNLKNENVYQFFTDVTY